jgi:hypothetical protein
MLDVCASMIVQNTDVLSGLKSSHEIYVRESSCSRMFIISTGRVSEVFI